VGGRRVVGPGQPPVDDHGLAEAADQDVRRLQVPVDHAALVGVGDRLGGGQHRSEERHPLAARTAPRDLMLQARAVHAAHRVERPAIGQEARVVDRHDAWMLQRGGHPDLSREPGRTRRSVGVEALDRDRAGELSIEGGEDRTHPAAGDHVAHQVARGRAAVTEIVAFGALLRGRIHRAPVGARRRAVAQQLRDQVCAPPAASELLVHTATSDLVEATRDEPEHRRIVEATHDFTVSPASACAPSAARCAPERNREKAPAHSPPVSQHACAVGGVELPATRVTGVELRSGAVRLAVRLTEGSTEAGGPVAAAPPFSDAPRAGRAFPDG
jgi:hypothetical protein